MNPARRLTSTPLLRVVRWMEPARAGVIRSVLLGAAALGSAVALIAVSAWLIARASQMPFVLDLTMATVSVRALGIGRALFRYLERLASHEVALRGMVRLRERAFDELAGRPHRAAALRRGDLLARFGADIDTVGDVVVRGLFPFAVAGVVALVTVVGVTLVLPAAGALLLGCLLLTGVVSPWLAGRAAAASRQASVDRRAEVAAEVMADLDGLAELEVAGAGERRRAALALAQGRLDHAVDRAAGPLGLAAAVQVLGIGVAVVGSVLLGAPAVESGQIGAVWLAVLALVPLAAGEITVTLPTAAVELVAGQRAAARLLHLVGSDESASGPPRPAGEDLSADGDRAGARLGVHSHEPDNENHPGLTAHDLRVGWAAPLPGVGGDLQVRRGEMLAIVGPSGAGKTTLALTLAGLHPPLAGQVRVDGTPVSAVPDLAHVVSFTAHDAHVFGTSVRENLLVATPAPRPDADLLAAARVTGLDEWLASLPDGLDTRLDPGGSTLSGGQRRRLLLTRALLTGAPYLILDEPTEHLDPQAATAVFAELAALARTRHLGIAVLTHASAAELPVGAVVDVGVS